MGYPECRVVKLTQVSLHFLTKFFLFNFGIFLLSASFEGLNFVSLIFLWVFIF
jgi:hypothetical protein